MTKKTGRNDPCPCGSGKKYKKCCSGRDEALARPFREFLAPPPEPVHPAPSELPSDVPRHVAAWDRDSYHSLSVTPSKVSSFPTETLLVQLANVGVETDRDRFVELARRKEGAWAVSDEWREELGPRGPEDEWFLGLAATELWLRWLPEVPCVETVDAQIAREYRECTEEEPLAGIVSRWKRIWADAAAILPDEVRTIEEASAALPMHRSLTDWLAELGDLLVDAAAEDESFGPEAERLIVEIRERFRGDRSDDGDFLLSDHANLVASFDPERAEAMLRAAVAERPDDSAPAVFLADLLARDGSREGLSRAIEVLLAARARPVRDAEAWSVEEHLDEFRRVFRILDASPRDDGT